MRSNLLIKLMGAFILVIVTGALILTVLTSGATQSAFNLYTTRSGQVWAERVSPLLSDYYLQTNTWDGVESILQSDTVTQLAPSGMGNMLGRGKGTPSDHSSGMVSSSQRILLTDDKGSVIYDSSNLLSGVKLSSSQLENGAPVTVDNTLVGTVVITPEDMLAAGSPAQEFIASVKKATLQSSLIAGIVALVLGLLLSVQITAPLRKLRIASAAIASGDLTQRVDIQTHDEIGELGSTFNRMAESLSNAQAQRQHMIADVAHELRTPLSAIQGTLEGMQDGVLPVDNEQLNTLLAETTLLNRLVGDLRLLSLADAGELTLNLSKAYPSDLITQVIERFKNQTLQKGILLRSEIQPDLPEICIDSDRIVQVLTNLVSNAMRYTPESGEIVIKAALEHNGQFLTISVTDNGAGISIEDLPHVFDRFYRADKSRARLSGGSGLGLAIARHLVEAHGGSISVQSPVFSRGNRVGPGTRFKFSLPVRCNQEIKIIT